MPCIHNQSINCQSGDCGKCGWNPEVSRRRTERIKFTKSHNLKVANKFRRYQGIYSLGCVGRLEEFLDEKIPQCKIQQLAAGKHPSLTAREWSDLENVLDYMLSEEDSVSQEEAGGVG